MSLKRYRNNLRIRAKRNNRICDLSLSDLHVLMYMARITVDDIGPRKHQYCLARLGDTGDYVKGNVRFITGEQNWKEYTETPQYAAQRKNGASKGGQAVAGKPRAGWTKERREKFMRTMAEKNPRQRDALGRLK